MFICLFLWQLFKMEDVSMGMWVERFNSTMKPVQYSHNWKFCQYGCMEGYFSAHYQSPRQMICLWDKLTRGKAGCCNFRWQWRVTIPLKSSQYSSDMLATRRGNPPTCHVFDSAIEKAIPLNSSLCVSFCMLEPPTTDVQPRIVIVECEPWDRIY